MRDELERLDVHHHYPDNRLENGQVPAILVVDDSGRIIASNQSGRTMYEKPGEPLIGKPIDDLVILPVFSTIEQEIKNKSREEHSWSGQFLMQKANGERKWTNTSISELIIERHKFSCLICLPQDFTKIEEIEKINHMLAEIDVLFDQATGNIGFMRSLARLFIPNLADWACIHLLQPDGEIQQVAVEPADILQDQRVYNWLQNDLPNDEKEGLPAALNSGKKIVVQEVNPVRRAADAGITSYMIAPLNSNHKTIGAITFVAGKTGKHFDPASVSLGENLTMYVATRLSEMLWRREKTKIEAEQEQEGENTDELQEALYQLKQSEAVIQSLFRLSTKLNTTFDVDIILDTLAQEAIEMVNGESGFAGLRSAEGMTVHKYYKNGAEFSFEYTWALGEGIPGWVLNYKVPYGTSVATEDPMIKHELEINRDVRSIICTPILDTFGEVIAYFNIRNKHGAEGFSISDQELLLTLAPVASIAIQNALAYQQRQQTVAALEENSRKFKELASNLQTARDEERLQVAHELHDELGQALTAIKFDLAWLAGQPGLNDETLSQKVNDISTQVNILINTVRKIATELRPGMLDDLGLAASIEWQAHDFEKRSGIQCNLILSEMDADLDREIALAIFRIFQEALTNILHYAEAKTVKIELKIVDDIIRLEVSDDGRGIKEEEIAGQRSLGLLGMRERTEQLGGKLEIRGEPGLGTTIRVAIPIMKKEGNDSKEVEDDEGLNR
jgi:signal transduction histidine kinase